AEVDLLQEARAEVARIAFRETEEVLQQEGHTAERTVRQAAVARLHAGAFEEAMDHRVDLRIHALDAIDRGVDQLERARLARPDELRLRGRVQPGQILAHEVAYDADRALSRRLRGWWSEKPVERVAEEGRARPVDAALVGSELEWVAQTGERVAHRERDVLEREELIVRAVLE